MAQINLPYGHGHMVVEIPDNRLAAVLQPKVQYREHAKSEIDLVREALENPIGSEPLWKLAQNKKNIVIISSDHTRPVPSQITMPILLNEIRRGNPEADVTILVATGFHRKTNSKELSARYGEEIADKIRIVVHDCKDYCNFINLAKLPSGGDLILNRVAVEADLLVAEGFIEPHFFAGFSGGRKSVLPGIAGYETIMANHCSAFIAHNNSRTGLLSGNPIHTDMIFAAQTVKLAFILNVVLDSDKKIIKAFAGHYDEAHLKGCKYVKELADIQAVPTDIVITTNGGYPLDQNIYQTVKCMTAAEATCNKNGVIIVVSQCIDGHGGKSFFETFARTVCVKDILQEILERPSDKTLPDQWESQILARILIKYHVIMVTDAPREMVERMKMRWASSVREALSIAEKLLGNEQAKITVIPNGIDVIVNRR